MTTEQFLDFFADSARDCYIKIYGLEKWMSLTDKEKHDVVMILANDLNRILG